MADLLRIVYGSTTIDLTTGVYKLMNYTQGRARRGAVVVSDEVDLLVSGTGAQIRDAIRELELAFSVAEDRYDNNRGNRVYLQFLLNGLTTTYQTEIVRPDDEEEAGSVDFGRRHFGLQWLNLELNIKLALTRRSFWEAVTATELSLSNGSGSGTGGRVIYNAHTAAVFSADTVSFTAATNTIADSGNGFGIFAIGDVISVRGSASGNDRVYTVATAAAGAITTTEPIASDEVAGATVSIYDIQSYVHIAAASIVGDLPAACRIEITNSDAGNSLKTVWMGRCQKGTPSDWAYFLEIGDSDTVADAADGAYANGIKRTYTIGTTEAKTTQWVIPTEGLVAADSGYFKFLIRFGAYTNVTDVKWRLKILYGATVIWESDPIQFDDTYNTPQEIIREINTAQLPPFLLEGKTPTDLNLALWGQSTSGSPVSIIIDYAILLGLESYRKLRSKNGLAQNSILVDDGLTKTIYQQIGTEIVKDISAIGYPIMLFPGQDNRIYFQLHSGTNGEAPYNRTASVKAYYRSRKTMI